MNIMFQESITKKEKRLKRQRIFWIVVFWLMSICFGALCIDFFKTASNEIELVCSTFWYICSAVSAGVVLFCVNCIIKI